MKNNELIVVEQLPIIKERLQEIRKEIEVKVETANALVCTEDTYKDIKKVRTELTKQFNELEEQRKAVKNAIMTPYNEFEAIYKENVSDLFKEAESTLKTKINNVENELKEKKKKEINEYFEEYKTSLHIGFVSLDSSGIKIGLNDSIKSLKEKVKAYLDKINDDLELIDTQEHKEEILVEYRDNLNVALSIKLVNDRNKRLEELKNNKKEIEKVKEQEQEIVKKVDEVVEIPTIEEPVYTLSFKVKGTKSQLQKIKNLIVEMGLEYE